MGRFSIGLLLTFTLFSATWAATESETVRPSKQALSTTFSVTVDLHQKLRRIFLPSAEAVTWLTPTHEQLFVARSRPIRFSGRAGVDSEWVQLKKSATKVGRVTDKGCDAVRAGTYRCSLEVMGTKSAQTQTYYWNRFDDVVLIRTESAQGIERARAIASAVKPTFKSVQK